jgi:uncharacterized protein (DUF1697 family)
MKQNLKDEFMPKYLIFLRAVNVGGNAIIKMSELKSVLEDNGFADVSTFINSGNIILKSNDLPEKTKEAIRNIIAKHFKLSIEMILKTQMELENILASDPYTFEEDDKSKRLVAMMSEKIDDRISLILKDDKKVSEKYYIKDDLIYIYYANGVGKSKFSTSYIEKKLGVFSTARNWNTLEKMLQLIK